MAKHKEKEELGNKEWMDIMLITFRVDNLSPIFNEFPIIEFPFHVRPEARNFIDKILNVDPKQRLSLLEARNHPWIQKHKNPNNMERLLPEFEKLKPLLPHLKGRYEQAVAMKNQADERAVKIKKEAGENAGSSKACLNNNYK